MSAVDRKAREEGERALAVKMNLGGVECTMRCEDKMLLGGH